MKNKFLLILIIFCFPTSKMFAGFPIGQGRWLLVPTYTRYEATNYWDNLGTLTPFDNKGMFQSNYLGLYGGFGIGRDLDLVFNIPYVTNRFIQNNSEIAKLSTVGDVSVGLCYFLNHYDYFKHLSLTGSLIFPMYPVDLETDLVPGFSSTGGEIKLGLSGTATGNFLKDSYYDVEAGVKTYFNGGPTQLFGNAALGVPLDEDASWKINGTLNAITSGSGNSDAISKNPYINTDFSYVRLSIGIGKKINRHVTVWGSIFKDIAGRSIGQGSGFSTYLVFNF